jgi:hypothetical protein
MCGAEFCYIRIPSSEPDIEAATVRMKLDAIRNRIKYI